MVNREQTAIVQRIYAMFLQGMTHNGIAQQLTADGILSPGGKPKWNTSAVKSILSDEKHKGRALLQKTYAVDYLTKKKKVNEGEIPQYYVEDNHEAIIDPDTFEMVQREMEKRGKGRKYHSGVHTFSSKIRCGECGSWYHGLTERFEKAKARLDAVTVEIHQMQTQRASIEDFLKAFAAMPDELSEFTLDSWHGLVDYGTVYADDDIRFTFKNGQEVKA